MNKTWYNMHSFKWRHLIKYSFLSACPQHASLFLKRTSYAAGDMPSCRNGGTIIGKCFCICIQREEFIMHNPFCLIPGKWNLLGTNYITCECYRVTSRQNTLAREHYCQSQKSPKNPFHDMGNILHSACGLQHETSSLCCGTWKSSYKVSACLWRNVRSTFFMSNLSKLNLWLLHLPRWHEWRKRESLQNGKSKTRL